VNTRKSNRKRRYVSTDRDRPSPIVQVMPGRRVRLDPSIVPQLAAWLMAKGRVWERQATGVKAKFPKEDDPRRVATLKWCEHAVAAVSALIGQLLELIPIEQYEAESNAVAAALPITAIGSHINESPYREPASLPYGDYPSCSRSRSAEFFSARRSA
jgi:hypothetical protein